MSGFEVLLLGGSAGAATSAAATSAALGGAFSFSNVLSALSAISGVTGAIRAGQAEAQSAEYNAALARNEAAAEEGRIRRMSARELGQMRAGIAKSGVAMEGTPLLALAESAELAELDALNVRYSGESSARLSEMRAKSARRAIPYNVGSSLLTTATRIKGREVN